MPDPFDVIVVGGGHAGTEAAAAAARVGARVALIVIDPAKIGVMSCNPAIGGLGKGHLVREVDACDGLMGRAADAAAIHHRMLNASKGSAVRGPRIQADRERYRRSIQHQLARYPNLTILAGEVADIDIATDGGVAGVRLSDGARVGARSVVLATGTFLGGRLFRGEDRMIGGRVGEAGAHALADRLRGLGLPMARLKTGTPPRLDGRTIDWGQLERQPSDTGRWTMSTWVNRRVNPQVFCAITRTTTEGHDLIRANLDRSPLFSGAIGAVGPRYCPSIEDKINRFGDRDGHQVFLEPEGLNTHLVYPNGISTSLPVDVQEGFVRAMPGLASVRIVEPGYAVEYDYIDPRALDSTLQLAAIPRLFCAGQLNGTTGYEEAAAQGLIAGANAASAVLDHEPFRPAREDAYLAVLVDDLTTQGVSEPYRMLTARAEYRLRLRADNAQSRLGPQAAAAGLLRDGVSRRAETRAKLREELHGRFDRVAETADYRALSLPLPGDGQARRVGDLVRNEGVDTVTILNHVGASVAERRVADEVIEDWHYAPYLARQEAELNAVRRNDRVTIAADLDYRAIGGLSAEMIERLERARPETLGQAGRIPGVTPAALSAILVATRRQAA